MNSWTISRRIIVGFTAMLGIVIALGLFAIWRGQTLKSAIAVLGDNSLPSVLTLRGVAGATRDNIFTTVRYAGRGNCGGAQGARGRDCREPGGDRRGVPEV